MSQISISRPIDVASPAGTNFPWERPFSTEPIATLDHNGANLFHIDMSPAASTRLLTARIADPSRPSIPDLAPELLLNRAAAIVRVASTDGAVSRQQIDEAFREIEASAIVLLAGANATLSREGRDALEESLVANGIDLVLTDLTSLTPPADTFVGRTWLTVPAWQRPPWPSSIAKAYIGYEYGRERALEDWAPTLGLLRHANFVLGVVNGDRLTGDSTIVNIAPLQVADVGEAPCTVVAASTA